MAEKIRIINKTGSGSGTVVMAGDVELSGITRIDFAPIEVDKPITAKITFLVDDIDLIAENSNGGEV